MDGILVIGVILLLLGFALAALEMAMPGFGAPGIASMICLTAGICFVVDTLMEGIIVALIILAILAVMIAAFLFFFSKSKVRSPFVLEEEQTKDQGYISSTDLQYLLGRKGTAATDLRPSGTGCFEDINFDVLSEGPYIEQGAPIQIIKVRGSQLLVKEIKNK